MAGLCNMGSDHWRTPRSNCKQTLIDPFRNHSPSFNSIVGLHRMLMRHNIDPRPPIINPSLLVGVGFSVEMTEREIEKDILAGHLGSGGWDGSMANRARRIRKIKGNGAFT